MPYFPQRSLEISNLIKINQKYNTLVFNILYYRLLTNYEAKGTFKTEAGYRLKSQKKRGFVEEKKYLSIEDVARRFDLNLTTVYRLAQSGMLPGFKLGSQWRFSEEMLESWVADRVTIEWFRAGDRKADRVDEKRL